jgi:hypothetical protein
VSGKTVFLNDVVDDSFPYKLLRETGHMIQWHIDVPKGKVHVANLGFKNLIACGFSAAIFKP